MKSVVTEYENISVFSQRPAECKHHLVGGSGLRKLAEEDGLTIPLTNSEHNMAPDATDRIHGNPIAEKLSKMLGQAIWEKEWYRKFYKGNEDAARESFRQRYGESYL